MASSLLSLREVCLDSPRGGWRMKQALRGVSLDVDTREVVCVLAQRAQGKTTLLRVAAGIQKPDGGRVCFEGRDLWELSERARSGLLVGRIALVAPVAPAVDVPMLAHVSMQLAGVCGRRESHARAMAALERVGVSECAHRRWESLADRERALVALARGIVGDPGLLLVDDLTATLGLVETDELARLVDALAGTMGMGVLMCVSEANATAWSQRIATLAGGDLLEPPAPDGDERDNVIRFPGSGSTGGRDHEHGMVS